MCQDLDFISSIPQRKDKKCTPKMRFIIVYYRIWVVDLKPFVGQIYSFALLPSSVHQQNLLDSPSWKGTRLELTPPQLLLFLGLSLYSIKWGGIFPSYLPVNRSEEMINRRYFTSSTEMTKLLKMVMVVFCFKKTKNYPWNIFNLRAWATVPGLPLIEPWQGLTANLITGN